MGDIHVISPSGRSGHLEKIQVDSFDFLLETC